MPWHRIGGFKREQLYKPSVLDVRQNCSKSKRRQSSGNGNCSLVAGANVVFTDAEDVSFTAHKAAELPSCDVEEGGGTRTIKKQEVENIRLEDFWRSNLAKKMWSEQAISRYLQSLAKSTWSTYNKQIEKFF